MNVVPAYRCNLRCDFCFLSMYRDKEDKQSALLDLSKFKEFVNSRDDINEIVIIGGEPFMLSLDYLNEFIDICYDAIKEKVDIYTNFTIDIPNELHFDKINLMISYDPFNRVNQNNILNKMLSFERDYSISMIVTKELLDNWNYTGLINFAKKIKRKIYLSNYEIIHGNEWSHRPSPEELAKFTIGLAKNNNELIHFKCIKSYNKVSNKKDIFHNFETHVTLNPSLTFSYNIPGIRKPHKVVNTYDEAKKDFMNRCKNNNVCMNCEYNNYCGKMYVTNNKCEYDKLLMNEFKKYRREN